MTDEMKEQITALRTAIMRRVEYDGCYHASSIDDEIGKWVREVFAEPKPIVATAADFGYGEPITVTWGKHADTFKVWSEYAEKMAANPTWLRTTYPTKTVTRTDAVAPGPQKVNRASISRARFCELVKCGKIDIDSVGLPAESCPRGVYIGTDFITQYRLAE